MPFIDELKDIFHNKKSITVEDIRLQIRSITVSSTDKRNLWIRYPFTRRHPRVKMDDAAITEYLRSVFETDDVVQERYSDSSTHAVSWYHFNRDEDGALREICIYWRV